MPDRANVGVALPRQDVFAPRGVASIDDRPPALAARRWSGLPLRDLTAIAMTAAFYYAGARIGLLPALVRGQVTPFWPPTGIAVVCLLVFGLRSSVGVAVAAFAVNAPFGPTLTAAAGIAVGNTLAPLAVVLALRALKVSIDLARLRDGVLFVVVAVTGMTVSASSGTAVLRLSGALSEDQVWSTWSVWWAGDAMGVLVVAPVLLQLMRVRTVQLRTPVRLVEAGVLLALVAVVVRYSITVGSPAGLLICPLLVWSAFRFRQLGAALVTLEVSVIASAAAASGDGAFGRGDLTHSMMILQLFNASIALTGLLLAAAITQLDDSRTELALANTLLSARVEQHGAELDRDRRRIAVLADRYRIAIQLHDTVLQRLFGVGTALEGAAAACEVGNRERLARVVDELDATINDLAVAIYQVEDEAPDATFRDAVDHVIAASIEPLGLRAPTLVLGGDGELIPLALRPQLLAALHEGLSDLATGAAGPRRVGVAVTISPAEIRMAITAQQPAAHFARPLDGVQRAAARARRLGGTCEWQTTGQLSTLTLVIPLA